jgi:tetratricopeptide (TPR) repeat protein
VAILDNLATRYPASVWYQWNLGDCLQFLGWIFAAQGRFPQAAEPSRRSIVILEKLAADHPQDMWIAQSLANAYHQMQDALLLRGDHDSSLEWAGRVIRLSRSLARRDPRNLNAGRKRLWQALAGRAETWTRLGRHAAALADFEEALELLPRHGLCSIKSAYGPGI